MRFEGWPDEALAFYAGLEADNSKPYWTSHKAVFEEHVHAPMQALLGELEPRFGPGRILRPHRDVRFTRDKSPYRTTLGARVGSGYVQVSARGLGVGAGYYHLAADQLARYRAAVDSQRSGEALTAVVRSIEEHGIEVVGIDALKTVPRGYSPEHPRIELLRYKGLIAWKQWQVEPWLGTPAAKDRVVEALEATTPLRDWLDAEVGPTAEPPRRRPGR